MKRTRGDTIILAFCRLGIAGLAPRAPGTWGTALACILAPLLYLPLSFGWRLTELAIIFVLGGLAATKAEQLLQEKDPGQVVIDELTGVWLAMLPFSPAGFWVILSAFILFRIFDIIKPWPIKSSEKWLPAGFGVMIDDVLAGVYAMCCLGIMKALGII